MQRWDGDFSEGQRHTGAMAAPARGVQCLRRGSCVHLAALLENQHGIYRSFVLNRDLITEDYTPVCYTATLSMATATVACPVPGCAGMAATKYGLRQHFRFLHPHDLVDVPGEGFPTRGVIPVGCK